MSVLTDSRLEEILSIAREIGWGAATILREHARSSIEIEKSGDSPVTTADLASNRYILDQLHAAFGIQDFAYLSEETYQAQFPESRLKHSYVWIIDPLDGTKDFINRTGEYAVHIALAYQGRPIMAIVGCPEIGKLYSAMLGGGAFVESRNEESGSIERRSVRVSDKTRSEELTIVASRSHRGGRFNQLMDEFPVKNQRQIGSVGCKIAAIVEQQADVYISLSGKSAPKDWDFAAPELILTEAGGKFTHFDGTALRYNREDVNQWGGILASNGAAHTNLCQTAERILQAIEQN